MNEKGISVTAVLAGAFWALAIGFCVAGAIVALTGHESDFSRSLGAVLCVFGMLLASAAMMFTVRRIAQRKAERIITDADSKTERIISVITAVKEVDEVTRLR